MRETLKVEPISGKNIHELTIKKSEDLQKLAGGEEPKTRHEIVIANESGAERNISLVERPDQYGQGPSYSAIWKEFKEAGLPVVPTLRKTERGTVLMTDLTANGSEIYGKALNEKLKNLDGKENSGASLNNAALMDKFIGVMDSEQSFVLERILKHYIELASKNGIILPADDAFELVMHPDGGWKLIILDLITAETKNTNPDTNIYDVSEMQLEEIQRINEKAGQRFLNDLFAIKNQYLKLKESPNM